MVSEDKANNPDETPEAEEFISSVMVSCPVCMIVAAMAEMSRVESSSLRAQLVKHLRPDQPVTCQQEQAAANLMNRWADALEEFYKDLDVMTGG